MARADATVQRLHVAADLAAGSMLELETKQAHYIRNVLRLQAGAPLLVFNGRDGEWRGVLETVGKKRVALRLDTQARPQDTKPDIWLLVAPVKKDRLDYLAQKATEMGVGRLLPVITARTQGGRHISVEKLRANVIEAAEQCNIMTLPDVADPQRLTDVLADMPDDRRIIFCDELAGADAQFDVAALKGQKLALLIGPEGGFDDAERAGLQARENVYSLTLGPRILRTDTAVVAALARVQAQLGDW